MGIRGMKDAPGSLCLLVTCTKHLIFLFFLVFKEIIDMSDMLSMVQFPSFALPIAAVVSGWVVGATGGCSM